MDYARELKRIEDLIKKGRTRQMIYVLVCLVFSIFAGIDSVIGGRFETMFTTAFFLCPIGFWLGYGEFAPFEDRIYNANAPRPSFVKWYFMRWPKRGRRVLKELKAYREQLRMKVGAGYGQNHYTANTDDRGSLMDF